MKRIKYLLLVMSFALCGCVGDILESKVVEPQVYVLHTTDTAIAKVAYPVQLNVGLPQAAPGLDSTRIAVLRNGNELDYYFGARWGGTAPQVVQAFVVELLQSQQGYKGVASEGARVDADYLLALELRDFQAEYASDKANPIVHVTVVGTLINIKSRKVLATVTASSQSPAKDNRLSAVVGAFQSATQQASVSLSEQLAVRLAQ